MLEAIKVAIELLSKSVNPSAISEWRRKEKLQEIGARLFLLYMVLNEVLLTGEDILDELDRKGPLASKEGQGEQEEDEPIRRRRIRRLLKQQAENFEYIYDQLYLLRPQLVAIDDEFDSSLHRLLGNKFRRLAVVCELIEDDRIPPNNLLSGFSIVEESISCSVPWTAESYAKIEKHVSEGRKGIEDVRVALGQLRTSLKETFSVQDILLRVGDEKFRELRV
jgi:hypothetical protein